MWPECSQRGQNRRDGRKYCTGTPNSPFTILKIIEEKYKYGGVRLYKCVSEGNSGFQKHFDVILSLFPLYIMHIKVFESAALLCLQR